MDLEAAKVKEKADLEAAEAGAAHVEEETLEMPFDSKEETLAEQFVPEVVVEGTEDSKLKPKKPVRKVK